MVLHPGAVPSIRLTGNGWFRPTFPLPDTSYIATHFIIVKSKPTKGKLLADVDKAATYQCAQACLKVKECNFFTYDNATKKCQLIDILLNTSELPASGTGLMYKIAG
jgi:hypothetical protein